MNDVKTYHKFLNKIKRSLQRKYNVGLTIEFNGYESNFLLNENKDIVFTEIPRFLIYIRTHDEYTHLDIVEYYETISSSMTNLISFRYKINEQHYIHKRSIEFLM